MQLLERPPNENPGSIPPITIVTLSLPHAFEQALLAVWMYGIEIRTEYDRKYPDGGYVDPPSRDATVTIAVGDPFAEPRIHKNIPAGPEELEIYRQEVLNGVHDHWVDPNDPSKWQYTYHQRLFEYPYMCMEENHGSFPRPWIFHRDQIQFIIDKLSKSPISRRAQAITWMPATDPDIDDPPCLQRIWCRLLRDIVNDRLVLNMNTHWRSRDLYKAWFMNAYAMTELMKFIALEIGRARGEKIHIGRYVDISDSLHIYGHDLAIVDKEVEKIYNYPNWEDRCWPSNHSILVEMANSAKEKLKANPDFQKG